MAWRSECCLVRFLFSSSDDIYDNHIPRVALAQSYGCRRCCVGPAFIVAAIASFYFGDGAECSWSKCPDTRDITGDHLGGRLSYTIIKRLSTHPEDKRYIELRKQWKGNVAVNTYLRIFLTQAVLATTISIAVIHTNLISGKHSSGRLYSWSQWFG